VISPAVLKQFRHTSYRSLGLVGSGQFGQVYCAIHRKTGRLVALKHLNRDRFPTHQFLRELRFLLTLNHPHIANCLALEQVPNGRQLVLDYCEGGTLRDLLEQETPLTLAEILTLIAEVLEALTHAQGAHIVHCDLKPENILLTLTPDGWRAKVSDFGIARLSQDYREERTGATGSPAYMAPERFYHQYAVSSDLYSIGVMLFEMLCGDRPFSGSYNQLMVAHLNHTVQIPDTLPPAVQALLRKSLEKLMARRFQSAAAMRAAIATARQTLTAAELRTRFPQSASPLSAQPFVPQTPPLCLPQSCVGLSCSGHETEAVIMASSGTDAWGWWLTAPPRQPQKPELTWHLPEPIQQIHPSIKGAIAATPHHLYRLQPGLSPQPLATFTEPIQLSPGGQRWLVVQSQETPSRFWLIDIDGRTPQSPRLLNLGTPESPGLSLVLDDRHLLLAAPQGPATDLYIASRHGKPYGKVTLETSLHRLFPSQEPLRFLAQAGTQRRDLLVIHLKPYRVMRCRLDITADWAGELATGMVVISQDGGLRLLNNQGQMIGKIDGLPRPQAIAWAPPHAIWLMSESSATSQLHCIDIRQLGLDIVF
jgi:serine/threonine protein kinase